MRAMDTVVLASASPRRQELLKQMGIPFIVCAEEIDESWDGSGDILEFACRLAKKKIESVLTKRLVRGSRWFIGADTLVICGKRILGKPKNREEAESFLKFIAGKSHRVITGVALYDRHTDRYDYTSETAWVRFAPLEEEEVQWYLNTGEWQGVAGGYRIQQRAACFVESLRGNYSTVMGLPIRSIYVILKRNNYPFFG